MNTYRIYIPQQHKNGDPVPTESIEKLLDTALDTFGEYIFNPMPVVSAVGESIQKVYVLEVAVDRDEVTEWALFAVFCQKAEDAVEQAVHVVESGRVI